MSNDAIRSKYFGDPSKIIPDARKQEMNNNNDSKRTGNELNVCAKMKPLPARVREREIRKRQREVAAQMKGGIQSNEASAMLPIKQELNHAQGNDGANVAPMVDVYTIERTVSNSIVTQKSFENPSVLRKSDGECLHGRSARLREREIRKRQREVASKMKGGVQSNEASATLPTKQELNRAQSNDDTNVAPIVGVYASERTVSNSTVAQKSFENPSVLRKSDGERLRGRSSSDTLKRPTPSVVKSHESSASFKHPFQRRKLNMSNTSKDSSQALTASQVLAATKSRLNLLQQGDHDAADKTKNSKPSTPTNIVRTHLMKTVIEKNKKFKQETAVAKIYEPEDFWRMVREWDFFSALHSQVVSQQQKVAECRMKNNNKSSSHLNNPHRIKHNHSRGYAHNNNINNGPSTDPRLNNTSAVPNANDKSKSKSCDLCLPFDVKDDPIPDTFTSAEEYLALWAPLCLKEAAAQYLSEFSTTNNGRKNLNSRKVSVSSLNKDVNTKSDYVTILIKVAKEESNNESNRDLITLNDVFVLFADQTDLKAAFKGELKEKTPTSIDDTTKRAGFLGHPEQFRRSYDRLLLKVSKRLWTALGAPQMYILKVGSNVTALREFTALCRIRSIPLMEQLLRCRKDKVTAKNVKEESVSSKDSSNAEVEKQKNQLNANSSKGAMIRNMGGVSALGKGFASYARKKFNPSQLCAISAAAQEYGKGGFTLVKGPPGTGKTTTLVALLNSLHIRQFNRYYQDVSKIVSAVDGQDDREAYEQASKSKPRLLVCAPSNAAVDNVISKIMADGFVDGNGQRYNPSMIRIGVGQADSVRDVALEGRVEELLSVDPAGTDNRMAGYRIELVKLQKEISRLRRRVQAMAVASPYPLSRRWEIRVDEETFDRSGRVFFVNHREKRTTFEIPPPPEPGEPQYPARAMPEYRAHMGNIVKMVERYNAISAKLQRTSLVQAVLSHKFGGGGGGGGNNNHSERNYNNSSNIPDNNNGSDRTYNKTGGHVRNNINSSGPSNKKDAHGMSNSLNNNSHSSQSLSSLRSQLESHIIDSVHIVLTTLGTAGSRSLLDNSSVENKFEVVVIDEAAQSVEPATLVALQLGSVHAILVGDPQQLPATIFSVSGRKTKYDRSLFQRLEEAGAPVYLLDTQYRMHPHISDFPRRIFYDGNLLDGPNVQLPNYGDPLTDAVKRSILGKHLKPFTILDLDSTEERTGGTSLSNSAEARLALHLYCCLDAATNGVLSKSKVAIITPYSQQCQLLKRTFAQRFGNVECDRRVEVNTVDAYQGRESPVVLFSCVRASVDRIGFLSDVRRMNVALTRAKHYLFVIARCGTIVSNPYWRDLVQHALNHGAVLPVPQPFPEDLSSLEPPAPAVGALENDDADDDGEDGELSDFSA